MHTAMTAAAIALCSFFGRDPEEEDVHIADAIGPDTVKDEGEDPKAGGKGRIGEAGNMDDLDDVQREQWRTNFTILSKRGYT